MWCSDIWRPSWAPKAMALFALAAGLGLGGCASTPKAPPEPVVQLLHDEAFAPPAQPISADSATKTTS